MTFQNQPTYFFLFLLSLQGLQQSLPLFDISTTAVDNCSSGAAQLKRTGIVRGCSQSWSDLFPFLTSSRQSALSHGVSVKQFKDEIKEISFLFCFGFANDLTPGFPNSSYKVVSLAYGSVLPLAMFSECDDWFRL